MRFGLFVSAQHPAGDDPAARLAEHVEQVRLVRDAGFHSVVAGQHFLPASFQMLQLIPLLAHLAVETGDMRVGARILLRPLLSLVEAAEQAAALDVTELVLRAWPGLPQRDARRTLELLASGVLPRA